MLDYDEFLSQRSGLLIAPAGYGKTHAICQCMNHIHGKLLILTHTHAGIASIKEKVKKLGIDSSKANIETISGFAFTYAKAFSKDIPEFTYENKSVYYADILSRALQAVELGPVQTVIKATYSALLVDEYQDCTVEQHELIATLSKSLKTFLFGDPLQGIFNFGNITLVDLNSVAQMNAFAQNKKCLSIPQRWIHSGQPALGQDIHAIRTELEQNHPIDLTRYASIEFRTVEPNKLFVPNEIYWNQVSSLLSLENLLLIHPQIISTASRIRVVKSFPNRMLMIEAIDESDFYKHAKAIDTMNPQTALEVFFEICTGMFVKSGLEKWIGKRGVKPAKIQTGNIKAIELKNELDMLVINFDLSALRKCLQFVRGLSGVICFRKEMFWSFIDSIEIAESNGISLFEAMSKKREQVRRKGRKVYGRCIGTTLLTKGLEFENVALLNAQEFESKEHFYVAISRATKRLVIFANSHLLRFN